MENVVPHRRADISHFETRLHCGAVIFDAVNFKRISRPRVWWTDVDWNDPSVHKVLGSDIRWVKHFGTNKIVCPQPTTAVHIPDGWQAPACWSKGTALHCLTTPAPNDEGRAAPRSMKGRMSSAVHNRWVASGRAYAPWHFEDDHVMLAPNKELCTPPIETKETVHHLPVGFTAGYPDRTRHRMVANSWHVGVARLLLWLLLLQGMNVGSAQVCRPVSASSFDALNYMKKLWMDPLHHEVDAEPKTDPADRSNSSRTWKNTGSRLVDSPIPTRK